MNDHSQADDAEESSSKEKANPSPLTDLTAFKRDQLFVIKLLATQNPHGLVIKEKLDHYYDEEINQGRLYQNLKELIEDGYVEKYPIDGRTNGYRPSEYANKRLEEHDEWERCCLCQEDD